MTSRNARIYPSQHNIREAGRTPSQIDLHRLRNSSALARLSYVTQVVDPLEGQVFHNRLRHTIKVAQIGRELAHKIVQENDSDFLSSIGGLDPETVEAAALAHDLGHPPFGHIAEKELDLLMVAHGEHDGFEGNAQSFRIVSTLENWSQEHPGLNLTRATLNAILKYPWLRQTVGKQRRKWSVYHTERGILDFARVQYKGSQSKSLETEIMDWADDITYSIHDLFDFYRAGLIPLELISQSKYVRDKFVQAAFEPGIGITIDDFVETLNVLFDLFPFEDRYSGLSREESMIRVVNSVLEDRYIKYTTVNTNAGLADRKLSIPEELSHEIIVLKTLTKHYVINNRALASQQHGKSQIIKFLFKVNLEAIESNNWWAVLPGRRREQLDELVRNFERGRELVNVPKARVVADYISSLTDIEAIRMYRRLNGLDFGKVTDFLPL